MRPRSQAATAPSCTSPYKAPSAGRGWGRRGGGLCRGRWCRGRAGRPGGWRGGSRRRSCRRRRGAAFGGPAEADERGLPDLRGWRCDAGQADPFIRVVREARCARQIPSKDRIRDWSPPSTSSSSPPSKGLRCPAGSRLRCNPPPGTSSRPGICRRRGRPQARWDQVAEGWYAGASVGVFPEASAGVFTPGRNLSRHPMGFDARL
jgi:hypothetical protein